MDVRIGVTYSPKELDIELPDDTDPDAIKNDVQSAVADGSVLWVTDRRGRQVGVPAEKLAYVEIGSADTDRRIGFNG